MDVNRKAIVEGNCLSLDLYKILKKELWVISNISCFFDETYSIELVFNPDELEVFKPFVTKFNFENSLSSFFNGFNKSCRDFNFCKFIEQRTEDVCCLYDSLDLRPLKNYAHDLRSSISSTSTKIAGLFNPKDIDAICKELFENISITFEESPTLDWNIDDISFNFDSDDYEIKMTSKKCGFFGDCSFHCDGTFSDFANMFNKYFESMQSANSLAIYFLVLHSNIGDAEIYDVHDVIDSAENTWRIYQETADLLEAASINN